jgi:DNA repair protein RadC
MQMNGVETGGTGGMNADGYEVSVYRLELVRTGSVTSRTRYANNPSQITHLFRRVAGKPDRVYFIAFYLDSQYRVTGAHVAAVGEVNFVHCPPTSVFKAALAANAFAVVLARNEVSGPTALSEVDVELAHQMELAGAVLGIVVLDYVVVGSRGAVSLRRADRMLMPDAPNEVSDEELDARLWRMRNWPGAPPSPPAGTSGEP